MLTAYAYNSIRLVQEGERVAAGSKIAEMGRSPQNKTLLHFELRVNGKPVDPLRHLPPR
jgi:lipoprotein NlpD